MDDERAEFEQRRAAFWKSAYGSGSGDQGMYPLKKKKLTEADRLQQMKGLSKAFVNPGGGWAKVDPVYVEDDSSSEDDDDDDEEEEQVKQDTSRQAEKEQQKIENDENDDEEDLVAMMRAQTRKMQQQKSVQPEKPKHQPAVTPTPTSSALAHSKATKTASNISPKPDDNTPRNVPVQNATPVLSDSDRLKIQALHRLLQIADHKGLEAAWEWARDTVVGSGVPNVWKEPPKTALPEPPTPPAPNHTSARPIRNLPLPVRMASITTSKAVDQERQFFQHFRESAKCTPNEFAGTLEDGASMLLVVRRPYGLESRPGLFESLSELPNEHYTRKAHVSTLAAMEVAVVLKPNLPVLLLFDESHVRYRASAQQKNLFSREWKMSGSPSSSLGGFEYMDANGRPTQYSLDDMVQQALWVRQQYATTLTSTAMGFKNRPPQILEQPKEVLGRTGGNNKTSVAVDTSDLIVDDSEPTTKKREFVAAETPTSPSRGLAQSTRHFQWWVQSRIPKKRSMLLVVVVLLVVAVAIYGLWVYELLLPMDQFLDKVKRELMGGTG